MRRLTLLLAIVVVVLLVASPAQAADPPACSPSVPSAARFTGLPSRVLIGRREEFGFEDVSSAPGTSGAIEVAMVGSDGKVFFHDTLSDFDRGPDLVFLELDLKDKPVVVFAKFVEHDGPQGDCTRVLAKQVAPIKKIFFPAGCTHKFRVRPRNVIVACGDGNFQLRRMRWRGWHRRKTVGRGIGLANDCVPYCAAGHFHRKRIKVRLSRPKRCGNVERYVYTRMTWRYTHGAPPPNRHRTRGSTRFPCSLFDLG